MRFASIPRQQTSQQRTSAAAETARTVVPAPAPLPASVKPQPAARIELPPDLDQRVRLVGEW